MRLFRRVLYKAPFAGPLHWLNLAVGCFCLLAGAFLTPSNGPLGLMFVFWGASDLLPGERSLLIIALRVGYPVFLSATLVFGFAGILQAGGF